MNRIPQNGRLIRQTCGAVQIDHKAQRRVARYVLCPTDDEFLRFRIEIPSPAEWPSLVAETVVIVH